jgi:hypothetical protein
MTIKPKFVSFDCYGTLINFEMSPTANSLFKTRVPAGRMPAFRDSFRAYRLDEVLGEWKPFFDVVENSIRRACKAHGIDYRPLHAVALYEAIPTWQPHPNVVEVLEAIAPHVPLVILSNSMVLRRHPGGARIRSISSRRRWIGSEGRSKQGQLDAPGTRRHVGGRCEHTAFNRQVPSLSRRRLGGAMPTPRHSWTAALGAGHGRNRSRASDVKASDVARRQDLPSRLAQPQPPLCRTLIAAPARGARGLNFWTCKGPSSAPA